MSSKPVIFVQGRYGYYRKNTYAQNIILKALSQGVTSPDELRRLAGLSKVADVYRTLDKLALRKEYHEALATNGVDFNFIVNGLKTLAVEANDKVKLGAYQTILKSIGLDKYEKQEDTGKGWEEAILAAEDLERNKGKLIEDGEYNVVIPETPDSELKRQENEKELADELYEDRKNKS